MEALLSSIGQSVRADSNSNNNAYNTIEDVCHSLASYVARRTDTRAEHISTTFEIRQNAVFDVVVEPEVAEGEDPVHHLQPPMTRSVNASDTIMNQPTDDPALQRMVVKHIIRAIGEVDGSSWNVRQVVRGAQGWDFTYQCKNSLQAWNRQNAKSPGRLPIAAWSSLSGQDPVNMSRPAFDCRGSVSVMFSRTSRAIIIKYEHTPLHKTVAELADLLAPTVPPPPVPNGNHVNQGETAAACRRRGRCAEEKKRKSKAADTTVADEAAPEGTNTPAQNTSNPGKVSTIAAAAAAAAAPFLNIPAAEAARRRELAVGMLSGKGIDPSTLSEEQMNIFSNQAPHLQELSLEMLAKYGAERLRIVHPDEKDQPAASTNSTPAQGTPDVAAASASAPATVPPGDTETPTKKTKPRKKKSDAAVESADGTAAASRAVEPGENGGMETTTMTLKPPNQRRTRGTCDTCKNRKVKCTKEHPVCSVCQEAGETCVYLPPRPRRKSEKPAEKSAERSADNVDPDGDVRAEEEDDAGEPEQMEQPEQVEPPQNVQPVQITPVPVPRPMQSFQQDAPAAPAPVIDPDNDEFIPDPNILSGPIEQPQPAAPQSMNTNYYASNSGVTYSDADSSEAARHAHQAMANLTFPSSQFQKDTSQASPSLFPFCNSTQPAAAGPPPVAQSQPARQSSRNTNRRSLPTGPGTQHQRTDSGNTAANMGRSPGWNNASHSPAVIAQDTTRSPTFSQAQAAKQRPKSRKSGYEAQPQAHAHPSPDTMQAAVTLSETASQQPTPHVSAVTRSPYQTTSKPTARAQSRQGHRSQTNTPVTQNPVPPPQIPTSYNAPSSAYGHSNASTTAPGYDTYGRYNASNTQYPNTTAAGDATAQSSYEPASYQTQSASTAANSYTTPAYDYSRGSGTADANTSTNDTSNYGTTNSSSSSQWTSTQARGSRSDATHSYSMPNAPAAPTSPYGTRSAARQASQAAYNQSQQPGYNSYQSQGANQAQQSQNNQTWYGFPAASANTSNHGGYNSNTANTTYGSTSGSTHAGAYSSHRPNIPGYGSSYGEEPLIFDLLSRGHTGN
ncbi:hypothetical protein PG994_012979 [Apiospora phragmitis]|uniref:Zn(2)-C6 fungal-type domain-containing protein n=1 Tax=Apiospora phragmitis TaxID=2905665 RepID=A0ABR1T7B9_9PEZI